MVLDILSSR